MARWIGDGYDQQGEFLGERITFRPLPAHRRADLARQLASGVDRKKLVMDSVRERLINCPPTHLLDDQNWTDLFRLVTGYNTTDQQRKDDHNLIEGVRLMALYPHFSRFSCESCRYWWVDPRSGTTARYNDQPLRRQGETLCETPQGCPAGHYTQQRRLSEKNVQAFRHYLECVAVGEFPDDPLVKHHARLIRWALDKAKVERCGTKSNN